MSEMDRSKVFPIGGVWHITGEPSTGKTTFALECGADPKRIIMLDDDVKGRSTVEELAKSGIEIGAYIDLVKLMRGKPTLLYHEAVKKEIASIKKGDFDVLIWDTWTAFQRTMYAYVKKNPGKFRDEPEPWSAMGKMKKGEMYGEARSLETQFINEMHEKIPTIFLITHLKDSWLNNVRVPGKQVPAASKALTYIPRCRLWLRKNPTGRPVPIGLALKELDRKRFVPGVGIRTEAIIPSKLTPAENEESLWDTIWRYWQEPFGNREPLPEELPNAEELSIIAGTMTNDQKNLLLSLLDSGLASGGEDDDDDESGDEAMLAVIRLHEEGKAPVVIAKETGLKLAEVKSIIESMTQLVPESE